jgi:hypothetical protein
VRACVCVRRVYMPACVLVCVSVSLSVCLGVSVSVCLCVYACVHVSHVLWFCNTTQRYSKWDDDGADNSLA